MTRFSVPSWHSRSRPENSSRLPRPGSPYLAQIIRDCRDREQACGTASALAYAQRKKGAPERHARYLDTSA